MRKFIAAFALTAVVLGAADAHSSILGCDRQDADPQYCQNGKQKSVCNKNGHLVWQDSGDAVSQGQLHFLSMDGRIRMPPCGAPAPAATPAAAAKPGG
jgi:hypothetical protein